MTNREKYEKEILDIACSGHCIAVSKEDNTILICNLKSCNKCICGCSSIDCFTTIKEWANSEYVEKPKKPKISESDRRFLDYLPNNSKWMVRNGSEGLKVYACKPVKVGKYWSANECSLFITSSLNISFPMIKKEDEEPWLIEDLKKLEVVDKYGKDDN